MIPAGPPQEPMASNPAPSPRGVQNSAAGGEASAGEPLAPGLVELLHDEVIASLRRRSIGNDFARFQAYAAATLNSTAAAYTGSEVTGNCRLRWYDHLLRNPLRATAEAEQAARELHAAVRDDPGGLARILPIIADKLDLPKRKPRSLVAAQSPEQALNVVKQALVEAQGAHARALVPLTEAEIRELRANLYPVLVGRNRAGHTLADRATGRRLCDLMERMDRSALASAAEALVPLSDPKLLEQLEHYPDSASVEVPGVTGRVIARIATPVGGIVIGGKEANTYRLDEMPDAAAVIDLGGGDTYEEGTVSAERPVLVILDLAGNDTYRATAPGAQGGVILGVSMLLDLKGDDVYSAGDVAQGSALAGVGILIDYAGDDRYSGVRRVQGQALGGLGLLIDRNGHDDYHAAMWAQGFGGPLGFGLLDDLSGDDHYYCGGLYPNSYKPETPGYEGWGQGVGAGIRQSACGGIGVILDGAGDDVYEYDYMAHGGGYWCGLGFARDFGGNDKRLICRKAFDGNERTEQLFQRFGCGWGCHYAVGLCFDDGGEDVYEGTIMGSGMAWDCAVGVLCDFGGNDRYEAAGGLTQGSGAQAGLGILFDYQGDDVYLGDGQGYAPPSISYHDVPRCGGNFSFLIDYGGKDTYGCEAENDVYIQRGWSGGFLIDRPAHDETASSGKTSGVKINLCCEGMRTNR